MNENITPYKDSVAGKKAQVSQMFDNVSGNYDQLNRVITFGMDIQWRKNMVEVVKAHQPNRILDMATGTGDMAIMFAKTQAEQIVGLDISRGMLNVAEQKIADLKLNDRIEFQWGDAENIDFDEASFDVVTVSYGIRNFEDLKKGLTEILRVLKPGGILVVLETSVPTNFFMKYGYLFYTKFILPTIGKLFSNDKRAYSYLSESAIAFPYGEKLKKILQEVGYGDVEINPQAGGISTIYRAERKAL